VTLRIDNHDDEDDHDDEELRQSDLCEHRLPFTPLQIISNGPILCGIVFSEVRRRRRPVDWNENRAACGVGRCSRPPRHQRSSFGLSPLELRDSFQRLFPECGSVTGDGSFTGTFNVSDPAIERRHQLGQVSQRARPVD
jgi:hypothetical protein